MHEKIVEGNGPQINSPKVSSSCLCFVEIKGLIFFTTFSNLYIMKQVKCNVRRGKKQTKTPQNTKTPPVLQFSVIF